MLIIVVIILFIGILWSKILNGLMALNDWITLWLILIVMYISDNWKWILFTVFLIVCWIVVFLVS